MAANTKLVEYKVLEPFFDMSKYFILYFKNLLWDIGPSPEDLQLKNWTENWVEMESIICVEKLLKLCLLFYYLKIDAVIEYGCVHSNAQYFVPLHHFLTPPCKRKSGKNYAYRQFHVQGHSAEFFSMRPYKWYHSYIVNIVFIQRILVTYVD
jgi:hypothetical protein